MTESPGQSVSLTAFFGGTATLDQVAETLHHLNQGYRDCLRELGFTADGETPSPHVTIRTGSLLVQLSAALEPGAWAASAIVLMKFLLKNATAVADITLIPADMALKIQEKRTDLFERRVRALELLLEKQPLFDQAATDAAQAAGLLPKRVAKALVEARKSEPAPISRQLPASAQLPPLDGTIASVRAAFTESVELINQLQGQLSHSVTQLHDLERYLAPLVAYSPEHGLEQAVGAVGESAQNVEDALRMLGFAEGFLNQTANTI